MPKLVTINAATRSGLQPMSGYVANIPLVEGEAPVKFLIEIDPDTRDPRTLTHYASGQQFAPRLLDYALAYRLRRGSSAGTLTKHQLASMAVADAVARVGIDKAREVIAAAPVINPEPRRQRRGRGLLDAPSYD
jgi:hypothetical protein